MKLRRNAWTSKIKVFYYFVTKGSQEDLAMEFNKELNIKEINGIYIFINIIINLGGRWLRSRKS